MFNRTKVTHALALATVLLLGACDSAEERAEAHFVSGRELIAEGDIARGIIELRNALAVDEFHIEARKLFAQTLRQSGDISRSLRQYRRLIETDPSDQASRLALAEMSMEIRNWEDFERHGEILVREEADLEGVAIVDLVLRYREAIEARDLETIDSIVEEGTRLTEEFPEDVSLRTMLVEGHLTVRDFDGALSELDTLIRLRPDAPGYWMTKAQILAETQQFVLLEESLLETLERFPDQIDAQIMLLRLYSAEGRTDRAEEFLRDRAAQTGVQTDAIALVAYIRNARGNEAALAEIDARLESSPEESVFRALRSSILFDMGQRDEAVALMQETVSNTTDVAEQNNYRISLAKMLAETRNEVGARQLVEEVLTSDPTHVEALKMSAQWLISDDRPDEAIGQLRIALDQEPNDADVMTLMSSAHLRMGERELAQDLLALAVEASNNGAQESIRFARFLMDDENFRSAEDVVIFGLRNDPANADLMTLLGTIYLELGEFSRASQVTESLRRLRTPATALAADELEVSIIAAREGRDEAIQFLENLAEAQENASAVRLGILRARLENGEREEALQIANELVSENPDDPRFAFLLGNTHLALQDYDAAAQIFEAVVSDFPRAEEAYIQLSRTFARQGDSSAARAVIERGLQTLPEGPNLLWAKASILEADGEIDEAIEVYERLYATNSNSPIIANNLASLLSTYRTDEESLERAYNVARRLRGTEVAPFQDTYGWLLHRRGNYQEALTYLEPAARALKADPLVQYHLGMTYYQLEQLEDAQRALADALDIAGQDDSRPQFSIARSTLEQIESRMQSQ